MSVSTRGSSNWSGELSTYTPRPFTLLLWPVWMADAVLALSMPMASTENVSARPTLDRRCMNSLDGYLPW
jgi:hypothetical protein